jgi:hypothetical protein
MIYVEIACGRRALGIGSEPLRLADESEQSQIGLAVATAAVDEASSQIF